MRARSARKGGGAAPEPVRPARVRVSDYRPPGASDQPLLNRLERINRTVLAAEQVLVTNGRFEHLLDLIGWADDEIGAIMLELQARLEAAAAPAPTAPEVAPS